MLPTINGKSFLECNEEDLSKLIEEPDYRENEYIDYKKNFAFLEISKDKKDIITQKKSEFKSDVCAFANAEGGYLIFGISDDNGCASELCGIDIPDNNSDKFELDRRNDLVGIQPRLPYLKFNFVTLENGKYVVIIYIKHDSFAPYLHVTDNKNYQAFRRTGNGKNTMTYMELRNMFNQSLSLDKEIYNYRKERIQYYSEQSEEKDDDYSRYLLLQIVPETFNDPFYNLNMLDLEKKRGDFFKSLYIMYKRVPCVDGLYIFCHDERLKNSKKGYIYNNGVIEYFVPLNKYQTFDIYFIWEMYIYRLLDQYKKELGHLYADSKVFICLSIIGCKGITPPLSNKVDHFNQGIDIPVGYIDRHRIMCNPVFLENISDDNKFEESVKKLKIEYLQSIGVKYNKELDDLLKEVYGSEPQGE